MSIEYSASLACANLLHLKEDIGDLITAGVNMMHIDIMDGNYVPNICLSFDLCQQIKQAFPSVVLDAHMMVTDPMQYIDVADRSGVDWYTFHMDTTSFVHRTIDRVKALGMKCGVAINPAEPVQLVKPILHMVDSVLVMAVDPGFSGQDFIEGTYEKIAKLKRLRKRENLSFCIQVDGGVDSINGGKCAALGADILVLGMFARFNQSKSLVEACGAFDHAVKDLKT